MTKLGRMQAREKIEEYLSQHPHATIKEIADLLGVSKQRAHILLRLLGMTTQNKGKDYRLETLTDRETQILRYIASGNSNKQIAGAFGVTESTIKNQVTVILAKLKANNRAHAVTLVIQLGLISLDKLRPAKIVSK